LAEADALEVQRREQRRATRRDVARDPRGRGSRWLQLLQLDGLVERVERHAPTHWFGDENDSAACIVDEVPRLLSSRARLSHLVSLGVSRSLLSERRFAELKTLCPHVLLERQRLGEMDEEMRCVAVGE